MRILGIINRTIVFRHPDIMLRLYKSLVRPHLEYCTAAWSPHYCKDKELIERLQRFTRMIPDLKDLSADLIEVYKIIHGLSAVRFSTFFELSHNERTRGHSLKLHKKRVMTDLRQHFFSDRIVNKWNTLSEDITTTTTTNLFPVDKYNQ